MALISTLPMALISVRDAPSAIKDFIPASQKPNLFRCSPKALGSSTEVGTTVSKDRRQRLARSITFRWPKELSVVSRAHITRRSTTVSRSALEVAETAVEETPSAEQDEDQQYQLAKVWRKIQGEDDWKDLLENPIDPIMRREILRYGEFSQITYDSFDSDSSSIYCGSCKYHNSTLFEKLNKGDCGYEVTKYLFATASVEMPKIFRISERDEKVRWSGDSNWMGYVAVATDEKEIKRLGRRDIMVVWRGTITGTEWIEDLRDKQTSAGFEKRFPEVKVVEGFLDLYTSSKPKSRFNKQSVREQLLEEVKRLLKKYEGEEISITTTGHSLGAALALLCAYDIAATLAEESGGAVEDGGADGRRKSTPGGSAQRGGGNGLTSMITVFSFAGPRVGNSAFKKRVDDLGVKVLRVLNVHDDVPKFPGFIWNENLPSWLATLARAWTYYHVGIVYQTDSTTSPMLRPTKSPADFHNLEALLHVVDGYHGPSLPFASATGRSPSLVNKSSGCLVATAFIPESWWQEMNKGLIDVEGQWVVPPRDNMHIPEYHNKSI